MSCGDDVGSHMIAKITPVIPQIYTKGSENVSHNSNTHTSIDMKPTQNSNLTLFQQAQLEHWGQIDEARASTVETNKN